jgi:iron complex outermembrane recepter protein
MNTRYWLLACPAAVLAMGAARAQAQSATADGAEQPALEEIMVTARRQSEDLQRVPISITALSQENLDQNAVYTPYDLDRTVPGLSAASGAGNPGEANFAIRGRGLNYGASSGSVETYFADVPLSPPFEAPTLPAQFFDLQSLQVLKGPQGTLFGRNTTGGAVLIVPQAPTDQFGGYARIQGGTYGDFQGEGAINLPLAADKADLRIAAYDWHRDGYSHTFAGTIDPFSGATLPAQTFNNEDVQEVRGTLLLRPLDGLQNSTIATYHQDHDRGSAGAGLVQIGGGAVGPAPGFGTQTSGSDVLIDRGVNRVWAVVNTTTYSTDSLPTIKNIFGYIDSSGLINEGTNADGTTRGTISLLRPPRTLENHQTTDELQLQGSSLGDNLTWITGGLADLTRQPKDPDTIGIHSSMAQGLGVASATYGADEVSSYGLFGSATYKLDSQFSVTAGYRHTWDSVSHYSGTGTFLIGNPVPTLNGPLTLVHKDFQGNTYNADLDYNASDATMLYVSYRHGYKRGGFNGPVGVLSPEFANFAPESVNDFSLGVKTKFDAAGIAGRFNAEAFYDLYHGNQVNFLDLINGGLSSITTNVAATTYRGVDADLETELTNWMLLNLSYTFIDAFNTKWTDTSCAAAGSCFGAPDQSLNLAVNPVAFVSRNKVRMTVRFHGGLPNNLGELAFAPSVSYQDRWITVPTAAVLPQGEAVFLGAYNALAHGADVVPSYTLLDLRAEWNRIFGSKLDAAVTVINATNRSYFTGNTGTISFGVQGNAYGPPRMVTFEVSTRF